LKLVDLIGKPWQRLTKYKLLLYAVLRPIDGAEPLFDADGQKKDIGVMVIISDWSSIQPVRSFDGL